MARTYPQFPSGIETRLAAAKMAAGEGEDAVAWLADPSCPYADVLKAVLRAWLTPGAFAAAEMAGNLAVEPLFKDNASGQTDEQRADLVLDEVQATIDAMRNIERSLAADDTDGKLSLLKSKTSLLEKWVQLKERTYGVKQVAEFQRLVIQALDEFGDKDKIQAFKKRFAELSEG